MELKTEKSLIAEAQEILNLAEKIQNDEYSIKEREEHIEKLSALYHDWYRFSLKLFEIRKQPGEKQKFEQEYEGTFFSSKILKFIAGGLKGSPLYDQEKPIFSKWAYPFESAFKEPLLRQCNILSTIESISDISGINEQEALAWNSTICRILKVFIEKAEKATTNHEKKLTYEYLAIFLIGAIEGLSLIGHDKRGASEEIDLWVTNEAQGNFWQQCVGALFIVECKNWGDPLGASIVRSLITVMDNKNIRFAILLSKNGVTGNEYRDATLELHKAANKQKHIIVIDYADLLEIANGMSPSEKIQQRYYELVMRQ